MALSFTLLRFWYFCSTSSSSFCHVIPYTSVYSLCINLWFIYFVLCSLLEIWASYNSEYWVCLQGCCAMESAGFSIMWYWHFTFALQYVGRYFPPKHLSLCTDYIASRASRVMLTHYMFGDSKHLFREESDKCHPSGHRVLLCIGHHVWSVVVVCLLDPLVSAPEQGQGDLCVCLGHAEVGGGGTMLWARIVQSV
jgi:hypothetical protein